MSACLRCKTLKVRCTGPPDCERCARAGVPCVPAPPSQQGKRPRQEYELPQVPLPVACTTSTPYPEAVIMLVRQLASEWGHMDTCTHVLFGFFRDGAPPSRESLLWLLRHWAGIASVRNSHAMLSQMLRLATACGISVSDVLLGIEASVRNVGLPIPPDLLRAINLLPGFGYARSASPCADGTDIVDDAA